MPEMSVFDELWLQIRLTEQEQEIERERRKALERLRGEMRRKYLRELFLETDPLARALYRYLDNHSLADLWNFCVNVYCKKAHDFYSRPRLLGVEMERLDSALSPLLEWLSKNPMPDGTHRNSRLFKNLAIFWVLKGLSDDKIRHQSKKILSMTPDKRESEIMGWTTWARRGLKQGRRIEVNLKEVNSWIEAANAAVYVTEPAPRVKRPG